MANHLVLLTDEFLARVHVGLGEIQSKFAIPVINDIEKQIKSYEAGTKEWYDSIKAHIVHLEAQIYPPAAAPVAEVQLSTAS